MMSRCKQESGGGKGGGGEEERDKEFAPFGESPSLARRGSEGEEVRRRCHPPPPPPPPRPPPRLGMREAH